MLEDIKEDAFEENKNTVIEETKSEGHIDPSGELDNMDMFVEDFLHEAYKEQINFELSKSPDEEYAEFFPENKIEF